MRLIGIAAAWALLAGCGPEAAGDPAILEFSVDPAAAPAGSMVTLHVHVENFVLTGEEGHDHDEHDHAETAEGDHGAEGHVHVYLDDVLSNPIAMMTSEEVEAEIPADAEVGQHVLIARLHGSDHLIIEPEITAEVDFEVLP